MKLAKLFVVAFSLALTASTAFGQAFTLSAGSGAVGDDIHVSLDSDSIVQGWSLGLCTGDSANFQVDSVGDGATTAAVAGGDPPDFDTYNQFPEGWTVGVVISFLGSFTLAPDTGLDLHVASYSTPTGADDSVCSSLDFCDTLGEPPVATVIVTSGSSIIPTTNSGQVCGTPAPGYTFTAPSFTITYDPADGAGSGGGDTTIVSDLGAAEDTQGFSMGVGNDQTLITPTGIAAAGELASINGGAGPDFFGDNLYPNGWTVGVVHAFLGGVYIAYDVEKPVISASYDTNAATLTGDAGGGATPLDFVDTLGDPPVANVIVIAGSSIQATTVSGTVTLDPVSIPSFIRGECNGDGQVDIADGVWILNELFQSGPTGPCVAACDSNDDGLYDQSDAVYIFNYQFLDGAEPPAPFPACGPGDEDDIGNCDTQCE